jgi:tetratricopeptide (TPR) repeat protein
MAVALLLAQAQIDMSLEASSTVVWVLAMLGAAGARFKKRGRGVPMCGGVLCGGLAVVVVAIIVVPWWRQDRLVAQAARVLVQAPGDAGGLADALVRGEASSMIRDAWQTQRDPRLLGHVASQQLAAASDAAASPAFAAVHLGEAARAGAEAMAAGSIAGGRLAIVALAARSDLAGERQWLQSALARAERVVLADPNAAMSWVTLARLAERSGELDRAARAWRRAIEIDDANTLDPAQRLPEAIRDEASAIAPPEQRPLHP